MEYTFNEAFKLMKQGVPMTHDGLPGPQRRAGLVCIGLSFDVPGGGHALPLNAGDVEALWRRRVEPERFDWREARKRMSAGKTVRRAGYMGEKMDYQCRFVDGAYTNSANDPYEFSNDDFDGEWCEQT